MEILSFRDLRVWQAGMELVDQIYQITRVFPKEEIYGLANQMRRAAVSVPSNIAEGHVREHTAEYLRFISIAHGSLAELQTQIEIAGRLGYINEQDVHLSLEKAVSLSRQLFALRNALAQPKRQETMVSSLPIPNP